MSTLRPTQSPGLSLRVLGSYHENFEISPCSQRALKSPGLTVALPQRPAYLRCPTCGTHLNVSNENFKANSITRPTLKVLGSYHENSEISLCSQRALKSPVLTVALPQRPVYLLCPTCDIYLNVPNEHFKASSITRPIA